MSTKTKRVVFLDRDGTINIDTGRVHTVDDWKFIDKSPIAIKRLREAGFAVAVVTNQAAVGRDACTIEDVDRIHAFLVRHLEEQLGTSLDAIAYCPHRPDECCDCRKPATGLALQVEQQLGQEIDYQNSWMVGDKLTDIQFGQKLGARCCLIRSRYWQEPVPQNLNVAIVDSLWNASNVILEQWNAMK